MTARYIKLLTQCIVKDDASLGDKVSIVEEHVRQCCSDHVPGDVVYCGNTDLSCSIVARALLDCEFVSEPKHAIVCSPFDAHSVADLRDQFREYDLLGHTKFFRFHNSKSIRNQLDKIAVLIVNFVGNAYENITNALDIMYPQVSEGGRVLILNADDRTCEQACSDFCKSGGLVSEQSAVHWTKRTAAAIRLLDHLGNQLPAEYEKQKRDTIVKFLKPDAKILEIGGRFGLISCTMNQMIKDPASHVVLEPDKQVLVALSKNKASTQCQFQIFSGTISSAPVALNGKHGTLGECNVFRKSEQPDMVIPTYTYDEFKNLMNFKHNTLVMDCEGAFVEMLRDFPDMIYDAIWIFIHWDARLPKNNHVYRNFVMAHGFREVLNGHQETFSIYERKNISRSMLSQNQ